MNRQSRKQLVLDVLGKYPDTRDDIKELVLMVWLESCMRKGVCFCPTHIRQHCSSPSSIDRDRRRKETLEKYPRSEDKFEKFEGYLDEFSPAGQWAMKIE